MKSVTINVLTFASHPTMAKIERPQAMVMSEVASKAKCASFSSFPVTTYIEFAFHNKLFVKRRMA